MRIRLLGICCACTLCVILIAGLWPFRVPKNQVAWLSGKNGLRFGRHGIVTSAVPFTTGSPDGACSLEILILPDGLDHSGTILAFDSSPDPRFPFAVRQFGESLAIQREGVDVRGAAVRSWLRTDGVFEKGKLVLLTITGDHGKTVVYANGTPVRTSSEFGLVSSDLTGRLVLGSSIIRDTWPGQIQGLAVYSFALTLKQVATHYQSWKQGGPPDFTGEQAPISLYAFEEQRGTVVHDWMGTRRDLTIAARYFVLRTPFLEPVWGPFRSRWDGWMQWGYWSDVFLNIAGFVPFGFFFALYFLLMKPLPRARFLVLVLGLATSLSIEVLQYFLPTRDSSMTDVLTNTIGVAVGIMLCSPSLMRRLPLKRIHERDTTAVLVTSANANQ